MAATKPKRAYTIVGTYTDTVTRLEGVILSNGATEHQVHRSHRNKRTWTCNCTVGQHGYCCDAMAAFFVIANKDQKARDAEAEAKANKVRAEAVTIRNDTGPRIFR